MLRIEPRAIDYNGQGFSVRMRYLRTYYRASFFLCSGCPASSFFSNPKITGERATSAFKLSVTPS